MIISLVSLINWATYIDRKLQDGEDPEIFCAHHPWELNYLLQQLKSLYPQYTETCIFLAIRSAMKMMRPPLKRMEYAQIVIDDLLKRKPFTEN